MKNSIFVDPFSKEILIVKDETTLTGPGGEKYFLKDGIPDLTFPRELSKSEKKAREFYDGRADEYEENLHLTFKTHGISEIKARETFISRLNIKSSSKVLEIACGTGRDSELIAKRLSTGELHLQDLSMDMLRVCKSKVQNYDVVKTISLSNACYLPYPDKYFDATYSFGALGEFSDIAMAMREMVRVTKKGGKIVVGDESIPPWLRNTNYAKILATTNPQFMAPLPLKEIPLDARNVNITWVIGGVFYLIDFEVGDGEPTANFDFQIPGIRGGTYRTRFEGKLEGVKPETKKLAWDAVIKIGLNMHEWLDNVVRKEAERILNKEHQKGKDE